MALFFVSDWGRTAADLKFCLGLVLIPVAIFWVLLFGVLWVWNGFFGD